MWWTDLPVTVNLPLSPEWVGWGVSQLKINPSIIAESVFSVNVSIFVVPWTVSLPLGVGEDCRLWCQSYVGLDFISTPLRGLQVIYSQEPSFPHLGTRNVHLYVTCLLGELKHTHWRPLLSVGSSSAPPGPCPQWGSGPGSVGLNLEKTRTRKEGLNIQTWVFVWVCSWV